MKNLLLILTAVIIYSCGKNKQANTQPAQEAIGSCYTIESIGSAPDENPQYQAFGVVCREKEPQSSCELLGEKWDSHKKYYRFTPRGSCPLKDAVMLCVDNLKNPKYRDYIYKNEYELEPIKNAFKLNCKARKHHLIELNS